MALLGGQSKQQGKSKGERWDVASAAVILIALLSGRVYQFSSKIRLCRVHVWIAGIAERYMSAICAPKKAMALATSAM